MRLPTPIHYILNFEDEANKTKMPLEAKEIETLEESLISFRLSGPNEGLSRQVVDTQSCSPCARYRGDSLHARGRGR